MKTLHLFMTLNLLFSAKVVFIMGPSGSGKTTIIRALVRSSKKRGGLFFKIDHEDLIVYCLNSQKYFEKPGINPENPTKHAFNASQLRSIYISLFGYFGHDVVIEDCKQDSILIDELAALNPKIQEIYFIKLEVSKETRNQRRIVRDGAVIPWTTSLKDRFYDLIIENEGENPENLAENILDYVENNKPDAVCKYYKVFGKQIEQNKRKMLGLIAKYTEECLANSVNHS